MIEAISHLIHRDYDAIVHVSAAVMAGSLCRMAAQSVRTHKYAAPAAPN